MIPIEDLTDVTIAIEDTDEDDEDDEKDLTDVTLVSDDTYWRLYWCYSSKMKMMKKKFCLWVLVPQQTWAFSQYFLSSLIHWTDGAQLSTVEREQTKLRKGKLGPQ